MFENVSAMSKAQHEALDALIAEASIDYEVDGVLVTNPKFFGPSVAEFILVIGDSPDTFGTFDRAYNFAGDEVADGDDLRAAYIGENISETLAQRAA